MWQFNEFQGATQQQKDMIEHAAQVIAQENVELMCAFIQKTASERAVPDLEKRLANVSCFIKKFFSFTYL